MSFKEYLEKDTEEINESISQKSFDNVTGLLIRLEKMTNSKSLVAREIIGDMGSGYKKDFDKITKMIKSIQGEWEQIEGDWQMGEAPEPV